MKRFKYLYPALIFISVLTSQHQISGQEKEVTGQPISISLDINSTQQIFGITQLEIALYEINRQPLRVPLEQAKGSENIKVLVADSLTNPSIMRMRRKLGMSFSTLAVSSRQRAYCPRLNLISASLYGGTTEPG